MTDYLLEIRFDTADGAVEELIQTRLFLSPSTGSASDEHGITAWFETAEGQNEGAASLADVAGIELRKVDTERVDWLHHYQQSLEPMLIGERFIVAPDASLIPAGNSRLALVIPQEQAFGTGSHETTSLCLEILETTELRGRRGLDVGSGSGILGLGMIRLGASRVVAFDNDPDAYAALRENRQRNGVRPEQMPLFIGGYDALRGGEFDVVTMNIVPEVILPALPHLVARLNKGARLIVSGVLIVRADEVIRQARNNSLELEGARERGEWWAGVFRMPS